MLMFIFIAIISIHACGLQIFFKSIFICIYTARLNANTRHFLIGHCVAQRCKNTLCISYLQYR